MSDRPPPEFVLHRQGPPIIRPVFLFHLIVGLAALILVALFALDSYFVVEPTEMAGVRRLDKSLRRSPSDLARILSCRSSTKSIGTGCLWTLLSSPGLP